MFGKYLSSLIYVTLPNLCHAEKVSGFVRYLSTKKRGTSSQTVIISMKCRMCGRIIKHTQWASHFYFLIPTTISPYYIIYSLFFFFAVVHEIEVGDINEVKI